MGYTIFALKGFGWMSFFQFFLRISGIIKIAIVARFLSPSDFGMFGMTMLMVSLVETFTETGISTFLIQKQHEIKKYINAAWVVQIVRGILAMVVIAVLAFPASLFFREQKIIIFILLASIIPFIKSFENPYIVIFQKELQFKKDVFYKGLVFLTDIIISSLLVIITKSLIGLIIGLIFSMIVGIILSWSLVKFRPRIHIDKNEILNVLSFIKWVTPLGILTYLANAFDQIIVGRILGAGSLGVYQIAQKFSSTPMIELSDTVGKVTFPIYAKIAHDTKRLRFAYIRTTVVLGFVEFLLMLFFVFFAREFIILIVGEQWLVGQNVFRILAIYGFVFSVSGTIGSLFFSLKRQDILTKIALVRFLLVVPMMIVGVTSIGTLGASYSLLFSTLILQLFIGYYIFSFFFKNKK